VTAVLVTIAAGGVAGVFGSLLGIGGGVFLVPFLNLGLGLPIRTASAVSLISVIATSSVTSAPRGRLRLVNLRLGMVLEVFTTAGGFAGVLFVNQVSERAIQWVFGVVMACVALVMVSRLDRRNVIADARADTGALGGRFHDHDTGGEVSYRFRRPGVGFAASFAAGFVSTLGIGGGVLTVPAMNAWCGVPLRVAAATSALMIGATAVVGSINYFLRGDVDAHLAAAAVVGVLLGSRGGAALGARTRARGLKLLMAAVLAGVAALYFLEVAR
jgi:uncharacterized membrane protein YfcA